MRVISFLTLFLALLLFQCRREPVTVGTPSSLPSGATYLQPSQQRTGNATTGYQYLIYGDYVSSGIPLDVYTLTPRWNVEDLNRTGDNDGVEFGFTAIKASNGVKVAAPNCLTCHAEQLNGQLLVGLGNNSTDYTQDQNLLFQLSDRSIQLRYGKSSAQWQAYMPLRRAYEAISPHILTQVRGVNPADKIFAALSAHRDANSLAWLDQPQFPIPTEVIPTDVPAWWIMKKKNALYYNGLGQGDFGRLSAASSILTMLDSSEARRVDNRFSDVMAWIRSLTPPPYPYAIDQALASEGKVIFEKTCSTCHGTYGANASYPNLLIDTATIGTDPWLARTYGLFPQYHTWYNRSWYAHGASKGALLPTKGYVAPPLDGIWATAPYFHNGSVPSLYDVLNSSQRPVYWKRKFDNKDYDTQKMGWRYTVLTRKQDNETYDATLRGYGKNGHRYGDALTETERKALLEYLKTL